MFEACHALDYQRHETVSGRRDVFAMLAREFDMVTVRGERDGEVYYEVGLTAKFKARYAYAINGLGNASPTAWERVIS